MKIVLSGASGLVGNGLTRHLAQQGHEIHALVRRTPLNSEKEIYWNPDENQINGSALEGMDGVIHLAGENLSGLWTTAKKARILSSRKNGTLLLSRCLGDLKRPPQVFISASAVGYYGDRGDALLDESAGPGKGFLADVCVEWENAALPAAKAGIRLIHSRFGIILDSGGGALARLLPLLRCGLGGKLGHGRQYWSWITANDVHRAIAHLLLHPDLAGPVNVTAPQPVSNAVFTRILAQGLHRPAVFAAPAFLLRLILGDMAQEMLLSSARAIPAKLLASGFRFDQADLASAVPVVLSKTKK
ncbi:MAG TPA: TIGR01777 family oxidoreductase [bacterium]|nr:TIGR01777 family oxidoreductase [bacterium]